MLELRESLGSPSNKSEGDSRSASPPTDVSDADLEAMPRKQFMSFMMENFKEAMKGEMKGIRDDLANTRTEGVRERVARAIEDMREKHEDFDDWQEEMKVRLKKNPALTPSELYTLVRADNPTRAKELDDKYGKLRDDADGGNSGEDGADGKKGFGGMKPGSGEGSGGQQRTDMDKDEAFEDAWEKSFGDHPELLTAGGE